MRDNEYGLINKQCTWIWPEKLTIHTFCFLQDSLKTSKKNWEISFMVQWLRLHSLNGGGTGQSLDGEINLQEAGHSQKKKKERLQCESVKEHKFMCFLHSKAKQPKHWSWELRKVYCKAIQKDGWLLLPKSQTPRRVSAKEFEGKWGRVRFVVADFLVQEFCVLAEVGEGQVMKFP